MNDTNWATLVPDALAQGYFANIFFENLIKFKVDGMMF